MSDSTEAASTGRRRTPVEAHGRICSLCYFDDRPDDEHGCLTSWCRCTCNDAASTEADQ